MGFFSHEGVDGITATNHVLQLHKIAPDFHAESSQGLLHFHDLIEGHWAYLFSHPRDFTPICTTEIAAVAKDIEEFRSRDVRVFALSRDETSDHLNWIDDIAAAFGVKVPFPIIADGDGAIAHSYGMIHQHEDAQETIRKSVIIDPALRVRAIWEYPRCVGRSLDEVLRVIDALQTSDRESVALPADWIPGDPVLLPLALSDDEATQRYGPVWRRLLPYVRFLHLPGDGTN